MRRSTKTIRTLAASLALALAATACAPGGSTTDEPAASSSASPVSKDVSGGRRRHLDGVGPEHRHGHQRRAGRAQQPVPAEVPQREDRAGEPVVLRPQDHAQAGSDLEEPAGRGAGQPGLPGHGLLRLGRVCCGRRTTTPSSTAGTPTFPQQQLNLNKFTADGKDWQSGNLYGVSQTGEIVGVYYNRKILKDLNLEVPKTITEFEAMLPTIKASGMLPIAYGDVEKSPGIHIYGITQAAIAGEQAVTDLVTGKSGAWTDEPSVKAAQTIQDWATKGYITEGANGISRDEALAEFGNGKSAFVITGTWEQPKVIKSLGADAGFVALGPDGSDTPVTTGGVGLAWAITTGSKHPDVAAAYIDFITNAGAAQVLIDNGNLPAVPPADWTPKAGTLQADVANEWKRSQHRIGPGALSGLRHPDLLRHVVGGGPAVDGGEADAAGVRRATAEGLRRLPEDQVAHP